MCHCGYELCVRVCVCVCVCMCACVCVCVRVAVIQADAQSTRMALQTVETEYADVRRQLQVAMNNWYESMTAMAEDVRCESSSYRQPDADMIEESLGALRLLDTSLRSNVKSVTVRCDTLLGNLQTTENELASKMEDISSWKLRASQYEEDASTYERNIVELQESNQSLQSALDSLSREMAAVTAAGECTI